MTINEIDTMSKSGMTKSKSLLVLHYIDDLAVFINYDHEEKEEDRGYPREVRLDPHDWTDLGKPDSITVTIESGDTLND